MEITKVALAKVTNEFLRYVKGVEAKKEIDSASEFLVVGATLLDLKLTGLLPQGEVVDSVDVSHLEASDLLFARLLQSVRSKRFPSGSIVPSTQNLKSIQER